MLPHPLSFPERMSLNEDRLTMTLSTLAPILVAIAAPIAIIFGMAKLSRLYNARRDPINDLIKANAFRYKRDGYEQVDQQKLERAGDVVWQEALKGQRLLRKKPKKKALPKNVQQFKRAGGDGH